MSLLSVGSLCSFITVHLNLNSLANLRSLFSVSCSPKYLNKNVRGLQGMVMEKNQYFILKSVLFFNIWHVNFSVFQYLLHR